MHNLLLFSFKKPLLSHQCFDIIKLVFIFLYFLNRLDKNFKVKKMIELVFFFLKKGKIVN
jgi:hypothetical protein